ncbi:MAG: hypothetical protein KJP10_01890 [Gammaproteobacteria bacterium]|nr:hypothetical protein [Gammaproteobacteria bacterium]
MSSSVQVAGTRQCGVALLIFVIVLALAAIVYMLNGVSIEQIRSEQALETRAALSRAKQALLDYAVTYEDANPGDYGFLPCPDYLPSGVEGGSDGNCDGENENILGLFPWASLETGILRSGTGQCLWYAVSGDYKSTPKTAMLNEDSNGAMRLYRADGISIKQGADAEDRVVAVIIDPAGVLPGQNRSFDDSSLCGLDYSPAQYLEGDGTYNNALLSGAAFAIDDFIESGVGTDELSTPYNDSIIMITRDELWEAILSRRDFIGDPGDASAMRRMTRALAECIAAYGNASGNRKLPRPAAIDFGGVADYREDDNYDDTVAASYLGRYPYKVDDSEVALAGYAANPTDDVVFNTGACNALAVTAGLPDIDLQTAGEEGRLTWKNWKDHFFYAVSSFYAPANAADTGVPGCDGTNCIQVGGTEYAAVVLYSGSRIVGAQLRNEPVAGDADDKNTLLNYIEVINPAVNGTGDFTPTGNDIAYCITDTDPLSVASCP